MGQTVSKWLGMHPSPPSPVPGNEAWDSQALPSLPLATPRSPIQRGTPRPHPDSISPKLPHKRMRQAEEQHTDQYLDFPALKDINTIQFFSQSKIMVLLKGLSGSGKTHIARQLQQQYPAAVVCSADHYFMKDKVYDFDRAKIGEAHSACQQRAREAAEQGTHIIVVDNTNVRNWEMKAYLQLAQMHHYLPLVMEPQTPWARDPQQLAGRNIHNLSQEFLADKLKRYEAVCPLYYGWFLNEVDSEHMLDQGKEWLRRALAVPEFYQDLSEGLQLSTSQDILHAFFPGTTVKRQILHCTAKYTKRGKADGAQQYMESASVQAAMGCCVPLHVVGYVLTHRTVGARIMLTKEQLEVWGQDDEEEEPPPQPHKNNPAGKQKTKEGRQAVEEPSEESSRGCSCEGTLIVRESEPGQAGPYQPTVGRGSRAHLTLATAPGVTPVTTGFDLIRAARAEGSGKEGARTLALEGGILRGYGKGVWVVYPYQQLSATSFFTASY